MSMAMMVNRCICTCKHTRNMSVAAGARITIPHRMVQKLEKIKLKAASKVRLQTRRYKTPLVIACKRSRYNDYYGQTYQNFNTEHLASHGWKHPKSRGDYFTINAYSRNPALDLVDSNINFSDLGLNQDLVNALAANNIKTPTKIQEMLIPIMLRKSNVICASETGSGKTLAYMLPILEWLCRTNRIYGPTTRQNHPYGVIVVPSRELALQTHAVAESLADAVGCRTKLVVGGQGTQALLRYRPQADVDLLISTPGVFNKLLSNRMYDMSRLSHVILDEADTLFDDSFSDMTLRIIRKMNVCSERLEYRADVETIGTQLGLVSATMPRRLDDLLKDIVPMESVEKVTTPHLHRLMAHVAQKFVRLGPSQRPEALMKVLKVNVARKIPTLVFCNRPSTSYYLGHKLLELGLPYEILNADMPQKVRSGRFDRFQNGECDILVCTDVASRGLDTVRAQHVVNYEFPTFMSDYIHRVGRVGRVASLGSSFALSFITYKWDVELLWKIEAAARRMTDLQNVNANIKRKLVATAERRQLQDAVLAGRLGSKPV